jgi:uncharacterized protein YaaQ
MVASSIKLLMLAVVQEQDRDIATRALEQLKLPVVYLSSAGGFLGRRNATLLIGLSEGKEEAAIKSLENSCRQRIEYLTLPLEGVASSHADACSRYRRRRYRICTSR